MVWSQQTNYELCLVKSPALLCRVTPLQKKGLWLLAQSTHVGLCVPDHSASVRLLRSAQKTCANCTCAAVPSWADQKTPGICLFDFVVMTWMVVTIESWGFFY